MTRYPVTSQGKGTQRSEREGPYGLQVEFGNRALALMGDLLSLNSSMQRGWGRSARKAKWTPQEGVCKVRQFY